MFVKILSGELLELPNENWEKPAIEQLMKLRIITPEDRPFTKLSLQEDMLFVELQTIATYMHPEKWNSFIWWRASTVPAAISFLEENLDRVDWRGLSANSAAGHLLREHIDKISFDKLSGNESQIAMEILEQHIDQADWVELAQNTHPAALALMRRHLDRVDYHALSRNWTPEAIEMIREFIHKGGEDEVDWFELTINPEAIGLLREFPHRVKQKYLHHNPRVDELCFELGVVTKSIVNKSTPTINHLELDKNWFMLSSHPGAGELLFANPERVDQLQASGNPCVYRKRS